MTSELRAPETFESWNSYWQFRFETSRKNRYIRSEKSERFLRAVGDSASLSDMLDEIVALKTLAHQQRREIAMLRRLAPCEASSICPICFRDFPHAEDIHGADAQRMKALPSDIKT
jgi:hypothetical protein